MTIIANSAVSPLIAATIAAVISFLGLIISKENKTSEFRQQWIDSLRIELSSFIAHYYNIVGLCGNGAERGVEFWNRSQTNFLELNRSSVSIRLRLNSKEPYSKAVLERLDEIEYLATAGRIMDVPALQALEKQLVNDSQLLLKSEWKRVKNGELVFRIARAVSLVVLLSSIFVLVFLAHIDEF